MTHAEALIYAAVWAKIYEDRGPGLSPDERASVCALVAADAVYAYRQTPPSDYPTTQALIDEFRAGPVSPAQWGDPK